MTQRINPMTEELKSLSQRQKEHYENIHTEYERHYFDDMSMRYRERYILGPLLSGLDLENAKIADLACGSGFNSVAILNKFSNASTVGFDISSAACNTYERVVGKPAREIDLTSGIKGDASFDAAIIVGGLHHCVANLAGTIETVSSFLRPGGTLLIFEPSKDFFLQGFRKLWYKADRYFDAQTEEALSHDELARIASPYFEVIDVRYMGGPGYFLVLNSLIFRVPHSIKKVFSPALIHFDSFYNRMPHKIFFPYFVARWKKRT